MPCGVKARLSKRQNGKAPSAYPIVVPQRGKVLTPIKKLSTDRAHWRPSRIAQTTRD